jgi:hypothetical protein
LLIVLNLSLSLIFIIRTKEITVVLGLDVVTLLALSQELKVLVLLHALKVTLIFLFHFHYCLGGGVVLLTLQLLVLEGEMVLLLRSLEVRKVGLVFSQLDFSFQLLYVSVFQILIQMTGFYLFLKCLVLFSFKLLQFRGYLGFVVYYISIFLYFLDFQTFLSVSIHDLRV